MELLVTLLYILFIVSAIVLVVVILLQEGRGGGLTDALGTAGQQTFGVAASGIHKFTGGAAAVFVLSALCIHIVNRKAAEGTIIDAFGDTPVIEAPPDGAPPATPPAAPPGEQK